MRAEQLVREGNLQDALEDLQQEIRKQPENSRHRVFLFQLLAVLGQWERVLNQLNVLSDLEVSAWPMLHIYREAIQSEVLRQEIFAGRRQPLLLGEPPDWMAMSLESMRLMGEGRYDLAVSLRNEAFEQAVASSGTINGHAFQWIADADPCLGPVLELILNGRYYWVPFQQVRTITVPEPQDLRDLVWLPAQFVWENGGQAHGLIPTRYVGSERSPDPFIQLARKTEWTELAEGVYRGLGQRMLATDQDEYPLLEVREIHLDSLQG
jgi:type VI secretion system protein ImpE